MRISYPGDRGGAVFDEGASVDQAKFNKTTHGIRETLSDTKQTLFG